MQVSVYRAGILSDHATCLVPFTVGHEGVIDSLVCNWRQAERNKLADKPTVSSTASNAWRLWAVRASDLR